MLRFKRAAKESAVMKSMLSVSLTRRAERCAIQSSVPLRLVVCPSDDVINDKDENTNTFLEEFFNKGNRVGSILFMGGDCVHGIEYVFFIVLCSSLGVDTIKKRRTKKKRNFQRS